MTLNWDKLRSDFDLRGSFEELCCQLARYESVPKGSQFIRKAPPDSGVECFWKMPDGSEWGWQAKYFRNSPSTAQWSQIDKSVKNALDTHPNLTKYFICLPKDRSDGRKQRQKTFLDKWYEHVQAWKQIKNIEFEYWGTSEIEDKLSDEKHSGRRKYFFGEEFLSSDWFKEKLQASLETAGPRYSLEMNVKLPIARKFEILGRTSSFYTMLQMTTRNIFQDFKYSKNSKTVSETASEFSKLNSNIDSITNILKNTDWVEQKPIDFKKLHEYCEKACDIIHKIILKLQEKTKENIEKYKDKDPRIEDFNNEIYHLSKLQRRLIKLKEWIKSDSCLVTNTGALLLRGDAGNGKTHLLCDVANKRILSNRFSVLLHGSHFTNDNPKKQIIEELDLDCTFDVFLGALNAVGQANNSKTLIMIDALNEGAGQQIWPKYLPELLITVSKYSWVGIAVSIRTSYEQAIIPKYIGPEKLSRFTHNGFGSKTEEAIGIFFDNNGIERPRVPLLVPEFSNPQFLLILCRGLKTMNLTKIPHNLRGLTSVYDFFIDTVNEKLARIDMLDYSPHEKIVHTAVERLAERMASKNVRFLPYSDAKSHLNEIYPSTTQSNSLIHHLISEGLLSEDLMRVESGVCKQVIQFAYERLGDNLIIKNQLKNVKTKQDAVKLFRKTGSFAKYFKNSATSMHRGMINAISIQLPEKLKQDLIEIKPDLANDDVILASFLDSFMWRHPDSVRRPSLLQIEKYVLRKRHHMSRFFKMILTVSADPALPLNGKYLHKYLSRLQMDDRDSVWSTFLHYDYYLDDSIVKRWIEWAWNADKSYLLPESSYLAGLTLSWFLTSSNRLVRDRATKALVSLLSDRIGVLIRILKKFARCNDPYVVERLFCAAYGCAMRSDDKSGLKCLAYYTYSKIFKNTNPPPNILIREYAKGIIDCAVHKGTELDIDCKKLNPPYRSRWIQHFPTENDVKELQVAHSIAPPREPDYGVHMIFNSLSYMGDFYCYIIKTNLDDFDWSTRLLPNNKPREAVFEEFARDITDEQKTPWKNYYTIVSKKESFRRVAKKDRGSVFGFTFEDDELDDVVKKYKTYLREKLDNEQRQIFDKYITPYVEHSFNQRPSKQHYDLKLFARWIVRRVFDFGWTKDKFGQFDHNVSMYESTPRSAGKPERMGKKYQWIAYYELLARASDNFEFNSDSGDRAFRKYHSVSQLMYGRNIDPSLLISKTFTKDGYDEPHSSWWFPFRYDNWDSKNSDIEWVKNTTDLPDFESIIEVTNPKDGSKWLVLGSRFYLQQKIPADQESSETPKRDIFFHLDSCLAKKSDISKLYSWGKKQGYRDGRFPEFDYTYVTFLGELYWEKSVQRTVNRGEPFWTKQGDSRDELPAKVYVPMYRYMHESNSYDRSTDEGFHILLPNKLLVEKMGLINKIDGTFVNSNGELVAYDPSVLEDGPSVLLIKKDNFVRFLQDCGYEIIWQIIGQKMILEYRHPNPENWKGCLDIHGIYRLVNNKVKGELNPQYFTGTTDQ